MAMGSEEEDTGEWISGGASSRTNQIRANVESNNTYQRMMIAPQSNSSGFNRNGQYSNEDN